MKLIFLDIDGVMTTEKSGNNLDPEKLKLLELLLRATDAKLVISSSWRRFTIEATLEYLTENGFPFIESIVGITPRMYAFMYNVQDKHYLVPRGFEVQWFLEHFSQAVENYVIIDDNTDFLIDQSIHMVLVNNSVGLTDENVTEAINILNQNPKPKDA